MPFKKAEPGRSGEKHAPASVKPRFARVSSHRPSTPPYSRIAWPQSTFTLACDRHALSQNENCWEVGQIGFGVSARGDFLRAFAAVDEEHHRHADGETVGDLFKNH